MVEVGIYPMNQTEEENIMKIKTIPVDTTVAPYAEFYGALLDRGLKVPAPLQLVSASAPVFNVYRQLLTYFMTHDLMSPLLLGCIRYTVAYRSHFDACIHMNRDILALHGVTDLSSLKRDEPPVSLAKRDALIYHFAVDALFYPERITQTRIATLNDQNISDALMFDAAFHGAMLLMMGPLVKSLG